jgi:hypothetical protein
LRVLKRVASRLLVFLFVLYALAEVSLLQTYCGNESIGIPPAHHFNSASLVSKANPNDPAEMKSADDPGLPTDRESNESCNDECLGSCGHMMVGLFFFEPASFTYSVRYSTTAHYENKYSNSNLTHLLRPPQSA